MILASTKGVTWFRRIIVVFCVLLSSARLWAEEDPIAKAAQERMKQELSEGKLPQDFLEAFQILSADQPGMDVLLPKLNSLLHQLYPNRDFAKEPIRILISASEALNAFQVGYAKPPIVIITRGMLKALKTEGQVQDLLAHEETHQFMAEKLGEGENSKGEELAAVVRPLYVLHDAGVDPRESLDTLATREAMEARQKRDGFAQAMRFFDAHPLLGTQRKALQVGLVVIKHERGTLPEKRTPLSDEFLRALDLPQYESYVEAELSKVSYKTLDRTRKAIALQDLIQRTSYWNEVRASDVGSEIEKLSPKDLFTENRQQFDALLSTCLAVPSAGGITASFDLRGFSENIYEFMSMAHHSDGTRSFMNLGPLLELERDLHSFMTAPDLGSDFSYAAGLAKKILTYLETQKSFHPNFFRTFIYLMPFYKLPERASNLPREKQLANTWDQAVLWAQQDSSGSIRNLLFHLGIRDARLFTGFSSRDVLYYSTEFNPLLTDDVFEAEITKSSNTPLWQTVDYAVEDLSTKTLLGNLDAQQQLELFAQKIYPVEAVENSIRRLPTERLPSMLNFESERRGELVAKRLLSSKYFRLGLQLNAPNFSCSNCNWHHHQYLISYFEELLRVNPLSLPAREVIREFYFNWLPTFYPDVGLDFEEKGFGRDALTADLSPQKAGFKQFDLDSPYIQFLLNAPPKIFSQKELAALFARHAKFHTLIESPKLPGLFGYSRPEDGRGLLKLAEQLSSDLGEFRDEVILAEARAQFVASDLQDAVWDASLYRLQGQRRPPRPTQIDVGRFVSSVNPKLFLGSARNYELRVALRSQLIRQESTASDLPAAVREWVHLHLADIFPEDNEMRFNRLKDILTQISKCPEAAKQILFLEQILFADRIQDPELRKEAMDLWAKAQRSVLGLDSGLPAFRADVALIINRVKKNMNRVDRAEIFSKLADAVEAQETLTEDFESNLVALSRELLEDTQLKGIVSEAALEVLGGSPIARKALLEFLISPLDTKSAETCARYIRNEVNSKFLPPDSKFVPDLKLLHRNFWAVSLMERAVILDNMLFPAISKTEPPPEPEEQTHGLAQSTLDAWRAYADEFRGRPTLTYGELGKAAMPDSWEGVFDYVLEKIFPTPADRTSPAYERSRQAKNLLRAFIHADEEYSRGLFLASLMAAAEKVKPGEGAINPGRFLGALLTRIDPATNRLAQLIDSNPSTPEDLRSQELEDSKIKSDLPPRWVLMRLYRKQVPEEERKKVKHIGRALGAATDWITVQTETAEGSEALAFLRGWIHERTDAGYKRLDKTAELLKDDPLAKIVRPLIEQARKASERGLDPTVAMQQYHQAVEQYDEVKLKVDGFEFTFKVAKWKATGPSYRRMDLAKGEYFKKLPEDSPQARARKKAWAKAIVFWNVGIIVGGGVFDDDRHNGQGQIEGDVYTLYDWGGMSLKPPSEAERKDLADLIFAAYKKGSGTKEIANLLNKEIQARISKTGRSPEYLVRVQRALLSLGDFLKYLDEKDSRQIFESILKEDLMHSDIKAAVKQRGSRDLGTLWKAGVTALRGGDACKDALIQVLQGGKKR